MPTVLTEICWNDIGHALEIRSGKNSILFYKQIAKIQTGLHVSSLITRTSFLVSTIIGSQRIVQRMEKTEACSVLVQVSVFAFLPT